jgi:TRAP-type transport system small permease protein
VPGHFSLSYIENSISGREIVKILKKIFNGLFIGMDKSLFYLDIGLMSGLVVLVIASVSLRYLFNIVFNWTEELIVFIFIATTYFGIILGVRWDEHIKVSILKDKLPPKVKIFLEVLISIITLITVLMAAYLSLGWIEKVGGKISSGLKLQYSTVYYMFTISFVMIAIYELREIVLKFIDFKKVTGKS